MLSRVLKHTLKFARTPKLARSFGIQHKVEVQNFKLPCSILLRLNIRSKFMIHQHLLLLFMTLNLKYIHNYRPVSYDVRLSSKKL